MEDDVLILGGYSATNESLYADCEGDDAWTEDSLAALSDLMNALGPDSEASVIEYTTIPSDEYDY